MIGVWTWIDRRFKSVAVARRFTPELRPFRWQLALVGLLSLAVTALELAKPWPMKWLFDRALLPTALPVSPFLEVVLQVSSAALLISLASALGGYTRTMLVQNTQVRVTRALRHRLFGHLTRLSPNYHSAHKSGDLLVRLMGDAPMLSSMLVESSVELATRVLLISGTLVLMLQLDAALTLLLMLLVPALAFTTSRLSFKLNTLVHKQRRKEGELADFLHEAIAATSTIQALGRSQHVVRRFARGNRRSARADEKAVRVAARFAAVVESLMGVGFSVALALGAWRVSTGHLSAGELLVFLTYVRGLLKPARSASKHSERIAKGTVCGERILDVLSTSIAIQDQPGAVPVPAQPRELEFVNVHHSYPGGVHALRGFSARFRRGELVALAGRSGSGKSSVAALCARLFDPEHGRVLLDGRALNEYQLDSLRECVGLCLQETVLFGETIRENLLLAAPEASDEELLAACRAAGAENILRKARQGLDTPLGSAGSGLSGGERRRLALARTLLKRSPILVLDEPFAGLDRQAVEHLRATLREHAREALVLVVAHDLSDLTDFTRVCFLDQGRLRAEGTHAELMARDALYCETMRAVEQGQARAGVGST